MRYWTLPICLAIAAVAIAQVPHKTLVRVESRGGRTERKIDRGETARFVRQISNAPCRLDRTYGVSRGRIWVDKGCRAEFEIIREPGRPGGGNDDWAGGWNNSGNAAYHIIRVESNNRRYVRKRVEVGRGKVRLVRKVSDSPCREGRDWGYDRNGIWVDHGCRADFEVKR